MLSPTESVLIKAVKQGHLTTWPSLMEDAINKHVKMIPATAMDHMNQKKVKHPFNQQRNVGHIRLGILSSYPHWHRRENNLFYAVVIDQGQL
jgi:hypothetical protein